MPLIIPENERSDEPLNTEQIIHHPDMERANRWVITDYDVPEKAICIFVPCSKKKPYHESPSHKHFDSVIFSLLEKENVHIVTFGTCGVVPRELDEEYPFMDYSFMMGKCSITSVKRDFMKTETERIAAYLGKTKDTYSYRIAYCIGDFREAMKKAVDACGIDVRIVPKDETIGKNIQPGKRFIYGSLSCDEYLADLAEEIRNGIKVCGLRPRDVRENETGKDADLKPENDTEWYA